MLVDGGPRYPHHIRGKEFHREAIQNVQFKERTRRLYNNIPSREEGLKKMNLFIQLSMLRWNYLRRHRTLGRVPVAVSLS